MQEGKSLSYMLPFGNDTVSKFNKIIWSSVKRDKVPRFVHRNLLRYNECVIKS